MARRSFRRTRKALTIVITLLSVVFVVLIGSDFAKEMIFNPNSEEDVPLTTTTTEMRTMAKSELLEELGFNYIAYSDINGIGHPPNTKEIYNWSGMRNFTSLEGEVQITADDKLVMCRFPGITLNEDEEIVLYDPSNNIPVRELTEKECLSLRHENSNKRICTFTEYLDICVQYEKYVFISIGDAYPDLLIPILLDTLDSYELLDRCILSSSSYETLRKVRKADETVVLAYNQPFMDKVSIRDVDDALDLGNCLIQCFNFSTAEVKLEDIEELIDKEVIAYAKERNVHVYEMQVHSASVARKLKEYGITGVQMRVVP